MRRHPAPAAAIAAVYVACVLLANILTEHFGLVPIGFGLAVTAGTFAAGATLLARNIGQDIIGRLPIIGLMVVGCGLSWFLATPALAVASLAAFGISEAADMAVFTPLRKRGWARAALAASTTGSVIDTLIFLHLAGFPVTVGSITGQVIVKITVCAAAVLIAKGGHAVLRKPVHAKGA